MYLCGRFAHFFLMRLNMVGCSIPFRRLLAYLQVLTFWLLMASLPFRIMPFQRVIMVVAGVFYLLDYVVNRRWQGWCWGINKFFWLLCIVYYLFIPLWHLADEQLTPRLSFVLEERAPFLLCGIIGLLGLSKDVKLKPIVYVMLLSCFAVSWYIILRGTGFSYFLKPLPEQSLAFMDARILYVASHMQFNLYLNITLVFVFWLLTQNKLNRWEIVAVVALSLWIFYLLCITEGRVGLGTCLLLVALFVAIFSFRFGWKVYTPILAAYICFAALVLMNNNRVTSDCLEHEPRWLIWQSDWHIISESPIWGHGVCDAKEALIYEAKNDERLSAFYVPHIHDKQKGDFQKVQPHNAFLEAWMEFGVLGLAVLVIIFLYPLHLLPRKSRPYCMLVVLCFVIQSCFDSFFAPLLYCLCILLLTSRSAISEESASQKPAE